MEDLEAKNTPQDHNRPPKKRKIFQEPKGKPSLVEEETRKITTPMEDLETKNGPQDPDLTTQTRKIFQEPRSKTNKETDPPSKKRKTFQEPKEETIKTTIGATSGGDCSHYNRPYKKLCTGVRPCKGLMQTLLGLGIDRPVGILRKKLCKTDVDPDQNRLQHSEKEVKQVLLGMMTAEEKQLATQEGAGDGLRVTVLDRLGRVHHMKFKMLRSKKYFRFRGSDYQQFAKNNNLKAGEILDTWASRVQLRGGGRMREDGDGGIVDRELLLVMLNYEVESYQENYSKETDGLTPDEKGAIDALLLMRHNGGLLVLCMHELMGLREG